LGIRFTAMLDEKPIAKELEFINLIFEPRSKLNKIESLEAITVLLERHGAYCYFCKKSAEVLLIEDDAVRRSKGLKTRERRILVVHERIRGIFDSYIWQEGNPKPLVIKWGNCVPACYSCNNKEGSVEPEDIDKKTMTWQAKKSIVRYKFTEILNQVLPRKIHICKKLAINIASNEKHLHCSQEVLEEAVKQNIGVAWDIIDITEFNIKCEYCEKYYGDNQHIIIKNKPPEKKQTDLQEMLKQEEDFGSSIG